MVLSNPKLFWDFGILLVWRFLFWQCSHILVPSLGHAQSGQFGEISVTMRDSSCKHWKNIEKMNWNLNLTFKLNSAVLSFWSATVRPLFCPWKMRFSYLKYSLSLHPLLLKRRKPMQIYDLYLREPSCHTFICWYIYLLIWFQITRFPGVSKNVAKICNFSFPFLIKGIWVYLITSLWNPNGEEKRLLIQ